MPTLINLSPRQGRIARRIVGERPWRIQKWPPGYSAVREEGPAMKALVDTNFEELMRQVRKSISQQEARLRFVRNWLVARRVPRRERDSLLTAVSNFLEREMSGLGERKPQMAFTATGRQAGCVYVRVHLTWANLKLGVKPHNHLMIDLLQRFTSEVSSLQWPQVRAHLLFVPVQSYKGAGFEEFIRGYAESKSLRFLGSL